MSNLRALWEGIGRPRILVFGDVMLDRYTWGDAEKVSPEAPVIVLRADQEEIRPGGAASVAYLLRHLEAEVSVAGVVGSDQDGHTLRALLRDEGINEQFLLTDTSRPTTVKHRFVGRASDRHAHQILRVDHESRNPICEEVTTQFRQYFRDSLKHFDAVLVSDYLKGTCSVDLLQDLFGICRQHEIPVLVDPGRTSDYARYHGATLLKPNRLEAETAHGQPLTTTAEVLDFARHMRTKLALDSAIITLDRNGMIAATKSDQAVIETEPRAVYDITGAGDMVLAALGLCMASGIDAIDASRLANVAAGLEVERFGIDPVRRDEIVSRLSPPQACSGQKQVTLDEMVRLTQSYRQQGKRIVFTNGCFDLLHIGHVTCLQEAASLGDVLVVAINSDASVRRLKGRSRPIVGDLARAMILAALDCVSHVMIFDEDTPAALIRAIRPDVLVKGGTTPDIVGSEITESYGGRVCRVGEQPGVSTTAIISRISVTPADKAQYP